MQIHRKIKIHRGGKALRLGALLIGVFVVGCARKFPEGRIPAFKILIEDFEVANPAKEPAKELRGWWLGTNSVRTNPRAGVILADQLARCVKPFAFASFYSRMDLKYYTARKRHRLKQAFPNLEDDAVEELIAQVPKLDFARELNADKMISGTILDSAMRENEVFHFWRGTIEVDCRLTDVASGKVEWVKRLKLSRAFASQYAVEEEAAQRLADALKEDYFRPLALAAAK